MWQPYSWDEKRVRMDEMSDMIQEGIKKGNSDSWIPRECLQVQKERDYKGLGEGRTPRRILETGHHGCQGQQHLALLQRTGQAGRAEDWM